MTCVTSVRYAVRFNGVMSTPFTPTRGLRQGDPLSPYLFLFVADGLSTLISRKINSGALQELKICRMSQEYHISSLQTIHCYFSEPQLNKLQR
jgi:hypothetical protein